MNIGGGALGDMFSNGDRGAAGNELSKIQQMYNNIKLPTLEEQQVDLNEYQSAGNLTPQMEQALQLQQQDALENIQLDPRLRQTQMNSLDTLSKIAGKGFTPDELNAAQQMQSRNEADLTSKLKQLQQQQDMRGVGTSDMALAQRMMEAQSSANRGAENARDLESQAFKRSLDAISQSGNLAGNIESQDYGRGLNLANAKNSRELTNYNAAEGANKSNVDRFNRALEYNLGANQDVMNKNTGIQNQQQLHNKDLYQTQFGNQMQLAGAKAGAGQTMANQYQNQANRTSKQFAGIGAGLGEMAIAPAAKPAVSAGLATPNLSNMYNDPDLMKKYKKATEGY